MIRTVAITKHNFNLNLTVLLPIMPTALLYHLLLELC